MRVSAVRKTAPDDPHPLHLKHVPRCWWPAVDELVQRVSSEADFITYTKLKVCCLHPSSFPGLVLPPVAELPVAGLGPQDVTSCLRFGYIRRLALSTHIGSSVKVFTVFEKEDTRRRVVFAPMEVNVAITLLLGSGFDKHPAGGLAASSFPVAEPTILPLIQHQSRYGAALTLDAPAFYTQLGRDLHLLPHTSKSDSFGEYTVFEQIIDFVFIADIGAAEDSTEDDHVIIIGTRAFGLFTPTSGCTGAAQMVALAQRIMLSLATATRRIVDVQVDVYIDNARLMGARADESWTVWKDAASACNLLFLLDGAEHSQSDYTFLGIAYSAGSFRPAEKTLRKCARFIDLTYTDELLNLTVGGALSIFGFLIYWNGMLRGRSHSYYFVLKYFRRRAASGVELSDPAHFWPCLVPLLRQWLRTISTTSCSLMPLPNPLHDIFLFTDATPTGWGCVIFAGSSSGAQVYVSAGTFATAEHINVLESRAVQYGTAFALRACPILLTHPSLCTLHHRIDNTSALRQHERGQARSWPSNAVVARTDALLPPQLARTWAFVASADQHADAASRLNRGTPLLI